MSTNMEKPSSKFLKCCPFQEQCYRKNPIHFAEYGHPHLDELLKKGNAERNEYITQRGLDKETILIQLQLLEKYSATTTIDDKNDSGHKIIARNVDETPTTSAHMNQKKNIHSSYDGGRNLSAAKKAKTTKPNISDKLANAAPYNIFYTAIADSKETHSEPHSITMLQILDKSLGDIESSVQINFMVDFNWLYCFYEVAGILDTPTLVLYGENSGEIQNSSTRRPWRLTDIKIHMPAFSTSHTKLMLIGYKDGSLRIVVSTANLYHDDWYNRTQGVWISPSLPSFNDKLDNDLSRERDSPTGFRKDLLFYLQQYKLKELQSWIERIEKCDFSMINVFFIGSVPGSFREGVNGHPWGHPRLGSLLQKYSTAIDDEIPVVCQSSSIGTLGKSKQEWIDHDFVNSLKSNSNTQWNLCRRTTPFKMIYPSYNNVVNSYDGLLGGGCLPYRGLVNSKQSWLQDHLFQWISDKRHRSRAMPHIKTYTRFDSNYQNIYWFVLTSANLSKAAWGSFGKGAKVQPNLRILNYEAGVLFLPRFVTGDETFPLEREIHGTPPFPLPYDVPLTPYKPADKPFLFDYLM